MREIKFRLVFKGKIFGIERIGKAGWEWMCFELNPDKGECWSNGVFPASTDYKRDMFTGLKDKNGKDVYESDIVITPKGVCEVTFELGCFYTIIEGQGIYRLGGWGGIIEVIGNRYEHPHLIPSPPNPPQ